MIKLWFEIPETAVELSLYQLALQYSQPFTRLQRTDGLIITCSKATIRRPTDLTITIPKSGVMDYKSSKNLAQLVRSAVENHSTLTLFEYYYNAGYQLKLTEVSPVLLGNPGQWAEFTEELLSLSAAIIARGYFTDYQQKSSLVLSEVY